MSVISLLVFKPERLPSIEIGSDVDLRSQNGYLPLHAFGRDTGFEFYFEAVPQGELPDEVLRFGSHHIVARTGGDFEEGRAALAFLRIAARLTDGAYVYPDDGIVVPPDEVQSYLAAQIAEYGKYIK